MMSSGSREAGFPGRSNIKELFSNDETLSAIEDFQLANGILLPSLQPALPLLDLHGVSRLEFHQSVFEEMRECMISRIKDIASNLDKKENIQLLNHLLVKSMTVIGDSKLRPIVLCIMQHLPRIEAEHLQVIANDKVFYSEASVEVKQQIWEGDQSLFGDEVSPILNSYIETKESSLFSVESRHAAFFQMAPKARRQSEMVQKLVRMVGKKTQLYEMILQFLRTLFLRTHNSHYCTLRSELLMSFHDKDVSDILSIDSCHKFAWCLDACIREKFVDNKRARELQGFLDSIRMSQERVLGDLSMILCDPQAIHTISISVLKNLQICLTNEMNPRASDDIILLIRMLSMGLKAWQMIDSRVFKEPKPDPNWIVRLLPSIGALMADDQIASLTGKCSDLDAVPAHLLKACVEDHLSAVILAHYAIYTAKQGLSMSIIRILPVLSKCHYDTVYSDMILHELVSNLNDMSDSFTNSEFCTAVFNKFFLPFISNENIVQHVLRLLWWVHPKLNQATLADIMNQLSTSMQEDSLIKAQHNSLVEKIKNYNQQLLQQQQMSQVTTMSPMTTPTAATSLWSPTYAPAGPVPSTPAPYYDAMPFRSPASMIP